MLKLITHQSGGIEHPDDPAFGPWRLDATFRLPSMRTLARSVATSLCQDRSQIAIRGKSKEALAEFVRANRLQEKPEVEITISQPEAA